MERDSTEAAGIPHLLRLQAGDCRGHFTSSLGASFKLDEGYSDETRSQTENEVVQPSDDVLALPGWILAHSEADRAELAYSVLRTLRTSTIAAVVDRLTPLLHMDPVLKLPPEITAEIFSYLDPATLLTASLASRAWRSRILDSRLWRQLYIHEGWGLNLEEIRNFERQQSETQNRKSRTRHSDTDMAQPKLKKRVPPSWVDSRRSSHSDFPGNNLPWNEQHGVVEADTTGSSATGLEFLADTEGDHEMHDADDEEHLARHSSLPHGLPVSPEQHSVLRHRKPSLTDNFPRLTSSVILMSDTKPPVKPSIVTKLPDGVTKLSWAYLYKQRRRLEENWRKGRFTNFQLPHPSHPSQAHSECVYAIQFVGKWLVSGSRDSTVRVWDLETRKLRGSPLIGHSKSVLCLQFDPSEKEDIIVSGSSDRNVIIWRFSTGEKVQELTNAHQDSVLNLRFDERFLVTCSKDKLIKIWNRRELPPSDKNYPTIFKGAGVKYPSYILDTSAIPPAILETQIANGQVKPLSPYSLLMTLDGHAAAVNAIQIGEDEIVSASGDRLIKVWDIHSGACLKTLVGHQKGIACVQFDSRRIVSGSNDDTVRIYDHASGAEVACLHGHQNLVRTVQAGFGDPPGAEERLRLEAMAVDNEYWEARRRGDVPDLSLAPHQRSSQIRSTGSRHPKDIMTLGAMIPPGGGGSSWGRIVSGSYDETIIIWQKDQEGKWVIGQRLRQEDAAKAASVVNTHERPIPVSHQIHHGPDPGQPTVLLQSRSPQQFSQVSGTSQPPVAVSHNAIQTFMNATNQTQQHNPQPNQQQAAQNHGQVVPPSQPSPASALTAAAPAIAAGGIPNLPAHHHHPPNHGVNRQFPNPAAPPTARVFKLQFDARKLICASQDHRIVGWDFASGDKEIEEASRFFVGL